MRSRNYEPVAGWQARLLLCGSHRAQHSVTLVCLLSSSNVRCRNRRRPSAGFVVERLPRVQEDYGTRWGRGSWFVVAVVGGDLLVVCNRRSRGLPRQCRSLSLQLPSNPVAPARTVPVFMIKLPGNNNKSSTLVCLPLSMARWLLSTVEIHPFPACPVSASFSVPILPC